MDAIEEFEDEWDICCERVVYCVRERNFATQDHAYFSDKEPVANRVIKATTWKTDATV